MNNTSTIAHSNIAVTCHKEALLILLCSNISRTLKQWLVLLVLKILSFISLKNLICRRILCLKTTKYVLKKCLCHVIGIAICCLYLAVGILWIYTKCNV